jgi:hypothetical protein
MIDDGPTEICQNCIYATRPIDPEYDSFCRLNHWNVNDEDCCEDGEFE